MTPLQEGLVQNNLLQAIQILRKSKTFPYVESREGYWILKSNKVQTPESEKLRNTSAWELLLY